MVHMHFHDPIFEADFRAQLLRNPVDILQLDDILANRKKWLDTCDVCFKETGDGIDALSPSATAYTCEPKNDFTGGPPIVRLLPELLIEIFLLLTKEEPPRLRETWDVSCNRIITTPHLGWIPGVTHVCSRWRSIGINAAILWADLSHGAILGSLWTQEFMSRAKSAPITIRRFDECPIGSIGLLCDYIQEHSPHIRDLTLSADWTSYSLVDDVSGTFSSMLVSASLDLGIGGFMAPVLFGAYAPNLKRLKLTNLHPWKSFNFLEHLLELDVFLCTSYGPDMASGDPDPILIGILPSISQVLDVLDEAAMLQHLALHYAFPSDDLPIANRRKTYLDHIQELSLSAKIMDCVSFFSRVVIPYNASLDLTCIPGLHSERFQDLFGVLTDRLAPLGSEPSIISRLEVGTGKVGDKCLFRVYTDSHRAVVQKARTSSRNIVPPRCDSSSKPFITLSLAYATYLQHVYVLRNFFSTMPLHDLTYLAIFGCWHVDPDGWRTIFRDSHTFLQSVRFLVLGQDCAQYFFHAIHDEEISAPELRRLAFPNLDTLILRNINFATFSCTLDEISFQEQMIHNLHDRERRGRKLRVLYFISCQGLDESWIADLREVVRFIVFGF